MGRLEKKLGGIFQISPSTDRSSRQFLHYCDYYRHRGVLNPDKAKKCVNRGCKHYTRYYER